MRRVVGAALVVAVLIGWTVPASADPWVRGALLSGRYKGTMVQQECTYDGGCGSNRRSNLVWRFTKTTNGVHLTSYVGYPGAFEANLRWVPVVGEYRGQFPWGKNWTARIVLHVTQQVRIGGVWTARKIVGVWRDWWTGAPGHHAEYTFVAVRVI